MKRGLPLLCILFLIVVVSGCAYYGSNTSKDAIPSGKYVAILEDYTNRSTLIGNTTYPPIPPMPIPTPVPIFDYDNSRGMLPSDLHHNGVVINASFRILLCNISYIDTPTMVGPLGMKLTGVYALPYTVEGAFTIENITQNGTVIARYHGEPVYLKPGDNWTATISSINTTGSYLASKSSTSGFDYLNATELPWPVKNDISLTITNEGIFNKTLLNGPH